MPTEHTNKFIVKYQDGNGNWIELPNIQEIPELITIDSIEEHLDYYPVNCDGTLQLKLVVPKHLRRIYHLAFNSKKRRVRNKNKNRFMNNLFKGDK